MDWKSSCWIAYEIHLGARLDISRIHDGYHESKVCRKTKQDGTALHSVPVVMRFFWWKGR